MPKFSTSSLDKLSACHPDLQRLFNEVIKHFDCTILCGHRNKSNQDEAYRTGKSKLKWPQGMHNKTPSLAVDVVPYPIDFKDIHKFYYFGGFVLATAVQLKIPIVWGGTWTKFVDMPHYELDL